MQSQELAVHTTLSPLRERCFILQDFECFFQACDFSLSTCRPLRISLRLCNTAFFDLGKVVQIFMLGLNLVD